MSRWKCTCAYDGSGFSGWQSQLKGGAVQDALEARLNEMFGVAVRIHSSGRTDAGVHAAGQVFHFDAEWCHGGAKLAAAIRSKLPSTIQIVSVRPVAPKFHARFSAKRKVYRYRLFLGDANPFIRPFSWPILKELDLGAMRAAAAVLEGRHDFKAFSALNGAEASEAADTVRNLIRLEVRSRGREVLITAEGDGFLYKMVRSLVGALVAVGEGKLSSADLEHILVSKIRTPKILTAPPQGLLLVRVLYR